MTPKDTLAAVGIRQRRLADLLGIHESMLRQMLAGRRPMRADLGAWLAALGEWIETHPVPRREKNRRTA